MARWNRPGLSRAPSATRSPRPVQERTAADRHTLAAACPSTLPEGLPGFPDAHRLGWPLAFGPVAHYANYRTDTPGRLRKIARRRRAPPTGCTRHRPAPGGAFRPLGVHVAKGRPRLSVGAVLLSPPGTIFAVSACGWRRRAPPSPRAAPALRRTVPPSKVGAPSRQRNQERTAAVPHKFGGGAFPLRAARGASVGPGSCCLVKRLGHPLP
jgi:hypothetical protein